MADTGAPSGQVRHLSVPEHVAQDNGQARTFPVVPAPSFEAMFLNLAGVGSR